MLLTGIAIKWNSEFIGRAVGTITNETKGRERVEDVKKQSCVNGAA